MRIPPILLGLIWVTSTLGTAFSSVLKNISEVGSQPTNIKSIKANIKKRLHKWGFLKLRNKRLKTKNKISQLRGSMQNCPILEVIKKIFSTDN